jgi:hypothetical protein
MTPETTPPARGTMSESQCGRSVSQRALCIPSPTVGEG